MITDILKHTWSIFLGIAFLMLGNGLQGTLISWRATYEGFEASTTGLIMTSYYIGFLAGSFLTPKLVSNVGHIRVFAAFASMASAAVLIQVLFISPEIWGVIRLLTGFCFAGTYVIVESWLNARSNNKNRGQVMSLYMFVSLGGLAGGQWLMNIAHPSSDTLFLLASILLSFALVPVLISRIKAPDIELNESISLFKLYRLAPSGSLTILFSAIAHGSVFGMGAVYAVKSAMTVSDTVLFMTSFILLGAISQWPVGWISDRFDRRYIVIFLSLLVVLISYVLFMGNLSGLSFILAFGCLGAASMPLYSLGVTLTNDELNPGQIVSASGAIILLLGLGSLLGPVSVGYVMDYFDLNAYFLFIGISHGFIIIGCSYFIFKYSAVTDDELTQFQALPPRATLVVMETLAEEAELSQGDDGELAKIAKE